ncbi:Ger(x)C family spore germination protein [Neobacillus sp. YX16]|uniref:Ger(x)C family spore germination protein n=1 Tax=Neobacillus sp. YX16 TaxID=3047874 RepID=UPI0024C2AC72|nr:Ger(x)C family spore germination protein [Neobacillus sp. YX16]WHZ05031.1 Ger(x)C family spore germination protein [Neobacillus sp. YX16]
MKKAIIAILLVLFLTGCWDRLPLKTLGLVDIAGIDLDNENGDVLLHYIVTVLNNAGQGNGEPSSQITELKGHSLIEAVGQGQYTEKGPFFGVHTGIYLFSKSFATDDPVNELTFLLKAPYTAINSPVVILEGDMLKLLKSKIGTNKKFTSDLVDFVMSLEKNKNAPNVSMMKLILSRKDPLECLAVPLLKQSNSSMVLGGALLYRQGTYTGKELDKDQVQILMLMLGKITGGQKFTGNLSSKIEDKNIDYAFSIKKINSKIITHPESGELPKVTIGVRLQINVFKLGKSALTLKPDYVNRIEKELSKHLEEKAAATIEIMQKANCDILGIGKEFKAYHPNIWKSLNWRKDFPEMSIEPNFDVQILNSDE